MEERTLTPPRTLTSRGVSNFRKHPGDEEAWLRGKVMGPDNNTDWWKADVGSDVDKPPEFRYGVPIPNDEVYVKQLAQYLLEGKGEISRKNVEAYMKVRSEPEKARNFLQMLLEANDQGLLYPNEENSGSAPQLSDELKADRYNWPISVLEELFHLDMWMKAVELLRKRGL